MLRKKRDKAAATCFFRRQLRTCLVLRKIVTDQLRRYVAATREIPKLASVRHVLTELHEISDPLLLRPTSSLSPGKLDQIPHDQLHVGIVDTPVRQQDGADDDVPGDMSIA